MRDTVIIFIKIESRPSLERTHLEIKRLLALSARIMRLLSTADSMITPIARRYDNSWPSSYTRNVDNKVGVEKEGNEFLTKRFV